TPLPRRRAPRRARADPRLPLPLRRVSGAGPRRGRLGGGGALPRAGPAGAAAGPRPRGVVRSRRRGEEPLLPARGGRARGRGGGAASLGLRVQRAIRGGGEPRPPDRIWRLARPSR